MIKSRRLEKDTEKKYDFYFTVSVFRQMWIDTKGNLQGSLV